MDTANDPALIAEAKKRDWELSPSDGETVQKIITEITRTSPPIIAKLRTIVAGERRTLRRLFGCSQLRGKKSQEEKQ